MREHRLVLLAVIPGGAGLFVALRGFYSGIQSIPITWAFLTWFPLQLFLLALASGVVIAPGAVVAIATPLTAAEKAFSAFAGSFSVLVVAEGSVYAASSGHFKERYLFTLMPLAAVAYGIYLKQGRPRRVLVFAVAAALAAAAARLPVSAYASGAGRFDSQFLTALEWFQEQVSVASASLLVAALTTAATAVAVLVALKGDRGLGIIASGAVCVAATVAATHVDLLMTHSVRRALPRNLSWIDASAQGPVTAIATPVSGTATLLLHLYWNPDVDRELLLANALPTDSYATEHVALTKSGTLANVHGAFLFDNSASRATFTGVQFLAHRAHYWLYEAPGHPRFRLLAEGYLYDDWLIPNGRFRVWPKAGAKPGTTSTLTFTLSLPRNRPGPDRIALGDRSFLLAPGEQTRIMCSSGRVPLRVGYDAAYSRFDKLLRPLSFRLKDVKIADLPPSARPASRRAQCHRLG